jgi:hypothetical protein
MLTALIAPAGGGMTPTFGDNRGDGLGTDSFAYAFTGFDAGENAAWLAELDAGNSSTYSLTIVFNNGGS